MEKKASCRLYVILARDAPVGVIFRRGPSKWVQLIKWHTDRDEFEEGQWFKGRIYERRCDLSPDGSLLIYFASKFNKRTIDEAGRYWERLSEGPKSARKRRIEGGNQEYTYAWTAISRPPYFTALALWPKGDCWHGGGLFESAKHVWLNHWPEAAEPHPHHQPEGLRITANPEACGEDEPIWARRMERDGWALVTDASPFPSRRGWKSGKVRAWRKAAPDGEVQLVSWLLRHDFEPYTLKRPGKAELPIPDARWADWDQQGRLVFAREGRLFAGEISGDELVTRELTDFNAGEPRSIEAPDWAKQW